VRPLNLKVKGFTSFRDEQEIDFTDLDLFVLWGPTGSGKSSLLDAMTYALFGRVERVGDEISQLISHGQPRLAVSLEFAVGNGRYLVTRSKAPKGNSTALLQRFNGEMWESFGDGADLVREVNKGIERLIGLDYEAFTRSVVLPQGKFAEFLAGDASKRRDILTELLGLELFNQMGRRAGEISREAKTHMDTKSELLEREYAGVGPEALESAKDALDAKKTLLKSAEQLEKDLAKIEKQWQSAAAARKALENCANEVRDAATSFEEAADELDGLTKTSSEAAAALKDAEVGVKDAVRILQSGSKKRKSAEGKHGALEDLAALRTRATSLERAREDLAETQASVADAEKEVAAAAAGVKTAIAGESAARKALDEAGEGLGSAQEAHDAAHRKDLVGAVVEGLAPGDPCPVCERPLETLPKAAQKEIKAAKDALAKAVRAEADARATAAAAGTRVALAKQNLEGAEKSLQNCKKEAAKRKDRLDEVTAEITKAVGKGDALELLDKHTAELRSLIESEEEAAKTEAEARRELERRNLAVTKVTSNIDRVATRMSGVPLAPICTRVSEAAPEVDVIDPLPDLPDSAGELASIARGAAKELNKLAQELNGLQAARDKELVKLVASADKTLPDGMKLDLSDISSVLAQFRANTSHLRTDVARAEDTVKSQQERLETKSRYLEEIETHRAEHATYRDLGKELRNDSIVQFLQAEALDVLAVAASAHLYDLSSARYKLMYEDDRFFVLDAWNGDERRPAKTLSGGETFQASLALALALSEQVQHLAVTERETLSALFLDEGFDNLDAETLQVVAASIEKLGSDGRLIGIVTHVADLAEQIPVRYEVTKSQRGSTLKRADAELVVGV
jgi:exonuclease SbcC